jgi:hypothetical protein
MPAASCAESPPAHPADVLDRLTGMLSEVASVRDLTAESFGRHLGVSVVPHEGTEFSFGQSFPRAGAWGLNRWNTPGRSWLEIRFDRADCGSGPPTEELTYAEFVQALTALGFRVRASQDRRGQITDHRFERGALRIQVFPIVALGDRADSTFALVRRVLIG